MNWHLDHLLAPTSSQSAFPPDILAGLIWSGGIPHPGYFNRVSDFAMEIFNSRPEVLWRGGWSKRATDAYLNAVRWIPSHETITVQGYDIGGMVYVDLRRPARSRAHPYVIASSYPLPLIPASSCAIGPLLSTDCMAIIPGKAMVK